MCILIDNIIHFDGNCIYTLYIFSSLNEIPMVKITLIPNLVTFTYTNVIELQTIEA